MPEKFVVRQKFFQMSGKKLLFECQANKGTCVAKRRLNLSHLPHISTDIIINTEQIYKTVQLTLEKNTETGMKHARIPQ